LSHDSQPSEPETVHAPETALARELEAIPYEPLLPIEKKLITACLVLGIVLLGLLFWISKAYFPVSGPQTVP
jgi:hypothetical protein